MKLFADDTSLYLIVDDPQETAQILNDDLVKLHAWSKMNKRGSKIDPWGTPAFMSRHLEVELSITTRCFLSEK
jgi:hypothetical protein